MSTTVNGVRRERRRSLSVSVALAAVVASTVAGCGSPPDNQGVCVDPRTNRRIDDRQCDNSSGSRSGGSGGRWYYYGGGRSVPGVGGTVSGGSYDEPRSGSVARGGAPHEGGVSRGGFGFHGGGGGGHGSVGG